MATFTVPHPLPSPQEDAERLRKAFQGFGTDEKAVINILAHRNADQRKQISLVYEDFYNQALIKRLESELKGDFERAIYRWMFDHIERQAIFAYVAAKGKLDYRVIIEIACIYNPHELLVFKQAYHNRYKRSLEEDVALKCSGDLRKAMDMFPEFLLPLVGVYRYHGDEVDVNLASSEAKILHEAIRDKVFHHDEIVRILTTRSKAQLQATFNKYKDQFGVTVTKNLVGSPQSDLVVALRIAIKCIVNPHKYFEKVLRLGTKGSADADALTRIIVTRAERDLKDIKDVFYKRNNFSLAHAVGKATSGDYKAFLLALIGE